MDDIQITGDELLEMFKVQVEKDYNSKVIEMFLEQEDKIISGCFMLENKIGYIKVPTDVKVEECI